MMRIGKTEDSVFGSGKWRRTVLLGYFSVFILILAGFSLPSQLSDSGQGGYAEAAYIKKGFTAADQWDADSQVDGLKVKLKIYNKNDLVIQEEGTLEVVLYEKLFDSDDNPLKGKELDRWKVTITQEDYAGELIKKLEYHKPVTPDFGWVEFTFTANDGSKYQTYDDLVYLKV